MRFLSRQVTCRDRNRIALQSDLLSAWVLGIKNVLALTGDLPALGDHPQAVGVYDLDSVSLLQTITTLNGGHDLSGNELQGAPAFFPGAVVKVDSNTEASTELQIIKMQKKIAAGAKYFQTQAVYSVDSFKRFMDRVSKFNVPVMAGVIPLKNAGMARYMNANVAGVLVPDDIIQKMADAPKEERAATGIKIAADFIKEIKPLCQGVHIMAIGWRSGCRRSSSSPASSPDSIEKEIPGAGDNAGDFYFRRDDPGSPGFPNASARRWPDFGIILQSVIMK